MSSCLLVAEVLAEKLKVGLCKVHANELQIVRSGCGGIGIVHQVLVLAHESRTPILEVRSGVWVKRRHLNEAEMDREDYLIF